MKSQILFTYTIFYCKNIQNTYFDWIFFFFNTLVTFSLSVLIEMLYPKTKVLYLVKWKLTHQLSHSFSSLEASFLIFFFAHFFSARLKHSGTSLRRDHSPALLSNYIAESTVANEVWYLTLDLQFLINLVSNSRYSRHFKQLDI